MASSASSHDHSTVEIALCGVASAEDYQFGSHFFEQDSYLVTSFQQDDFPLSNADENTSAWLPEKGPEVEDGLDDGVLEADLLAIGNLVTAMRDISKGVPRRTHKRGLFRKYHNCFTGSDMVDWLLSRKICETREMSEDLGRLLRQLGCLHHIGGEHDFEDSPKLFRFTGETKAESMRKGKHTNVPPTKEQPSFVQAGVMSTMAMVSLRPHATNELLERASHPAFGIPRAAHPHAARAAQLARTVLGDAEKGSLGQQLKHAYEGAVADWYHPNRSFSGKTFVLWLIQNRYARTPPMAILLGQDLVDKGHVLPLSHTEDFDDDSHLRYRLHSDDAEALLQCLDSSDKAVASRLLHRYLDKGEDLQMNLTEVGKMLGLKQEDSCKAAIRGFRYADADELLSLKEVADSLDREDNGAEQLGLGVLLRVIDLLRSTHCGDRKLRGIVGMLTATGSETIGLDNIVTLLELNLKENGLRIPKERVESELATALWQTAWGFRADERVTASGLVKALRKDEHALQHVRLLAAGVKREASHSHGLVALLPKEKKKESKPKIEEAVYVDVQHGEMAGNNSVVEDATRVVADKSDLEDVTEVVVEDLDGDDLSEVMVEMDVEKENNESSELHGDHIVDIPEVSRPGQVRKRSHLEKARTLLEDPHTAPGRVRSWLQHFHGLQTGQVHLEEPRLRTRIHRFWGQNHSHFYFGAAWILANIAFIMWGAMWYAYGSAYEKLTDRLPWSVILAKAASFTVYLNAPLTLILMSRWALTAMRQVPIIGFLTPVDHHIAYHRVCACAFALGGLVHTVGHLVSFADLSSATREEVEEVLSITWAGPWAGTDGVHKWVFTTWPGLTGVLMWLCFILMFATAIERVRRWIFEVFWLIHHLFIPLYILLVLHGIGQFIAFPLAWAFLTPAILIYAAQRFRRIFNPYWDLPAAPVKAIGEVIWLCVPAKETHFKFGCGQWLFLNWADAPTPLLRTQWHPFTISSAPLDGTVEVHARAAGDWTKQLHARVKEGIPVHLRLDGAYGAPVESCLNYSHIVLVSAGIGITPMASVLRQIRKLREENRCKPKRVYLFWLNRDPSAFSWFDQLLADMHASDPQQKFLLTSVYLTGLGNHRDIVNFVLWRAWSAHFVSTGRCPFTHLPVATHWGRPDWSKVFSALKTQLHGEQVGVFSCGPPALNSELALQTRTYSDRTTSFRFQNEHF